MVFPVNIRSSINELEEIRVFGQQSTIGLNRLLHESIVCAGGISYALPYRNFLHRRLMHNIYLPCPLRTGFMPENQKGYELKPM